MNEWTEIRRKVLVDGASKRSVCREYGLGWWTLYKILTHPEPPGYRVSAERSRPKLGEFLGVIDEILEADKTAPVKQRHTARRIFERLRDEYGYSGGITQVREAVAQAKAYSKEVFVPLSHPPGHAQFDFGEATVEIAGERRKAALAVMTLPYSDAYFLSAYPRECTETFHAGHQAAFSFYGTVPLRTSYDNTSIAVKKIVGAERDLTREFLRLQSHFLFDAHFCRVGRGNEKGHVETHVGYSRRNLLVPVPSFSSFTELNEYLAAACYADLFRRVRGKAEEKAVRLEEDRAAMLALPAEAFEVRRVEQTSANSLSLVRFDRNHSRRSTSVEHVGRTTLRVDLAAPEVQGARGEAAVLPAAVRRRADPRGPDGDDASRWRRMLRRVDAAILIDGRSRAVAALENFGSGRRHRRHEVGRLHAVETDTHARRDPRQVLRRHRVHLRIRHVEQRNRRPVDGDLSSAQRCRHHAGSVGDGRHGRRRAKVRPVDRDQLSPTYAPAGRAERRVGNPEDARRQRLRRRERRNQAAVPRQVPRARAVHRETRGSGIVRQARTVGQRRARGIQRRHEIAALRPARRIGKVRRIGSPAEPDVARGIERDGVCRIRALAAQVGRPHHAAPLRI